MKQLGTVICSSSQVLKYSIKVPFIFLDNPRKFEQTIYFSEFDKRLVDGLYISIYEYY